jgi:hypothetical protein
MQAESQFLDQLRDIHTAAVPSFWPPAPGWWLLAAVALLLLFQLLRVLAKHWVARKRRARLMAALKHIQDSYDPATQPNEYLSQLNRLFRVVALKAFPGTASTRLQGPAWVGFLRSLLPEGQGSENLSALETGPYEPAPAFDAEGLSALAREWVKRYG